MRVITFKIDEELNEALEKYCIRNSITKSEAIRRAIRLLINYDEKLFMKEKMSLKIKKVIIT